MKKAIIIILIGVISTFAADTTYVDSSLYVKITLPQSWMYSNISDSTAMIFSLDTINKANLFITRYKTAGYQSAREWTQSYFVAYKVFVESSHEPYGQLLWFDSTSSSALQSTSPAGQVWAPWLYAEFKSVDSTGMVAWGEYERFTANKNFGYEMYAISDTTDMKANYTKYATILQKIELLDNSVGVIFHSSRFQRSVFINGSKNDPGWYTITGRRMSNQRSIVSSGFYCNRTTRAVLLRP